MRQINRKDIEPILIRFPKYNIKKLNIYSNNKNILFNEKIIYYVIKPQGKKSLLWFTYIEKKIMAILVFMANNDIYDRRTEFYEIDINFDNTLCYNNVLLFGYYINNDNLNYFIVENIYNYNVYNYIIERHNYNSIYNYKLQLFSKILNNINNSNKFFVKLPYISNSSDNIFKTLLKVDYKIYSITGYYDKSYYGNYILNSSIKNKIQVSFKVQPLITEDIYSLNILTEKGEEYYDLALINTYKLSVYMNSLFRNIKENNNLDLLELSDDEDEFENISSDKYVNIDKYYIMDCEYSYKFKKWIPIKISNNNIITKQNLLKILKINNI